MREKKRRRGRQRRQSFRPPPARTTVHRGKKMTLPNKERAFLPSSFLLWRRFHNRDWIFSYGMCRVFPLFFFGNIFVSVLSMTLIAVNRFVGIYYAHLVPEIFNRRNNWFMVYHLFVNLYLFNLLKRYLQNNKVVHTAKYLTIYFNLFKKKSCWD